MNYKSQLNGWAVEMAIKAKEAGFLTDINPTMEGLLAATKQLVDYAYNPEKEFQDCIKGVTDYLKTSPDAQEKVEQLMGELDFIHEDIQRQAALKSTMNGSHGEAMQ